jgi:hypothetical protein
MAGRFSRDGQEATMARAKSSTPNSHWLFLQIVATVSRSRGQRLSVSAVAKELGFSPSVIGHCIALHQLLERDPGLTISLPLKETYRIPGPDDVIDRAMLEPPVSAGLRKTTRAAPLQ